MHPNPVVIDGNNAILSINRKKGNLECLTKLIEKIDKNRQIYPIISNELKYRLENPTLLPSFIQKHQILVTPANVDTDVFILETLEEIQQVFRKHFGSDSTPNNS